MCIGKNVPHYPFKNQNKVPRTFYGVAYLCGCNICEISESNDTL